MKHVSAILAMTPSGIIGNGDQMAWKHRGDLMRFKCLTTGHTVVMGYRTFFGMLKHHITGPVFLPDRRVVVIAEPRGEVNDNDILRDKISDALTVAGVTGNVVPFITSGFPELDITQLRDELPAEQQLFIVGGNKIFAKYISLADTIYLTLITLDGKQIYGLDDIVKLDDSIVRYITEHFTRGYVCTVGHEECNNVYASYHEIDVTHSPYYQSIG